MAGEWKTIESAPHDTNLRVAHELEPSSFGINNIFKTFGQIRNNKWVCTTGFVCTDGMFRFDPTHWLDENGS